MNLKKLLLSTLFPLILLGCSSTANKLQDNGSLRVHHNTSAIKSSNHFAQINWQNFSDRLLTEKNKQLGIEVSPVHDGSLRIVIPGKLIQNNDLINPKAHDALEKIIKEIKSITHPLRVKIVGHHASYKNDTQNQLKSLDIAYQLTRHFILAGVRSTKINTEGRGSLDPFVDSKSPHSKQLNRRLEIYLYPLH